MNCLFCYNEMTLYAEERDDNGNVVESIYYCDNCGRFYSYNMHIGKLVYEGF